MLNSHYQNRRINPLSKITPKSRQHLILTFVVGCLGLASLARPLVAETIQRVHLTAELSKDQWRLLDSIGVMPDQCGGGDIYLKDSQLDLLRKRSVGVVVLDSMTERTGLERGANSMGGYRTLDEIGQFLDDLAATYPSIVSPKDSVGATAEGRPIWVVKISDNVAVDEDEPEVFYNSLIHAREPASGLALQRFMEYLCQNYGTDPTVTNIVDNRELYFMPVVNPDGYVYNETTNPAGGGLWRKNRRLITGSTYGVDLNRNFDFEWGQDAVGSSPSPSNETYRGSSGFSEPETQVFRDFVLSHHFTLVNNMHSYSNLFLWPWGSSARLYTPLNDLFSIMGDSATKQNLYAPQVGWELYPTNGASDEWFWGDTLTRPPVISFTTEIGRQTDGFWPPVNRIAPLAEENIAPNLFLARVADNPYRLGPPRAPHISVVDTAGSSVTVTWQNTDPHNTPVSFDLRELRNKQRVTDGAEQVSSYWSVNRMARSTARAKTGTFSWKSQNVNAACHSLTSSAPYLVQPGDSLSFWTWYDLEADFDYFYAGVATDGYSFVSLANNLTTNSNPNQTNLGNGITGMSTVWRRCAFDLSPYVGKYVYFRLALITDEGTLREGIYLDDLSNIELYQTDQIVASGLVDTSVVLNNQNPGNVLYSVREHDTEGQTSSWSHYDGTTIPVTFILGDVNNDQSVDIADLTEYVGYLFLGSPASLPVQAANIDCSPGVDIGDLTLLVDHLFISFSPLGC